MKLKSYIAAILMILVSCAFADEWSETRNGIKNYEHDDYDEALDNFKTAKCNDEQQPIHFLNIGSTLYKQQKFGESIIEQMNGLNADSVVIDTHVIGEMQYNIGNSYFRTDSIEQAEKFYRSSLMANPDDEDAKHNLELVMRMKSQSQCQNQQQQQQQQNQDQQNQEQQQEQNQDQQQQEQQQEQQHEQQQELEQEQQQEQQQQPKEGEMTREQAERLMEAMERQEQEELQSWFKNQQKEKKGGGRSRNQKDW